MKDIDKKCRAYCVLCLVFGIIGMILGCIIIGLLCSTLSIAFGIVAITTKSKALNKPMIIFGFSLSALGILLGIVMLIAVIITPSKSTITQVSETNESQTIEDTTVENNDEKIGEPSQQAEQTQEQQSLEIQQNQLSIENDQNSQGIELKVDNDSVNTERSEQLLTRETEQETDKKQEVVEQEDSWGNFKRKFICFIALIVIFICLFLSINDDNKFKTYSMLRPTDMSCPECKATNITVSMINRNATTLNLGVISPALAGISATQIGVEKVAVCQCCGCDFPVITAGEINNLCIKAKNKKILHISILVVCIIVILFNKPTFTKTEKNNTRETVVETANVVETNSIETTNDTSDLVENVKENSKDVLDDIKRLEQEGYTYITDSELALYGDYYIDMPIYTITQLKNIYSSEGRCEPYVGDHTKVFDFVWEESFGNEIDALDYETEKTLLNIDVLIYGKIGEGSKAQQCKILTSDKQAINDIKDYIINKSDRLLLTEDMSTHLTDLSETFKSDCEEVSYDTLLHNPDLYKSKKIKVKVKVIRVDADGWIMQGTQLGIMENNKSKEIALSDNRKVRTPRFVEGETITLYGYGDGTRTMNGAGVGGTLSDIWSGDSGYEIPCISIVYTGNDNYEDWLTIIKEDTNDSHVAR